MAKQVDVETLQKPVDENMPKPLDLESLEVAVKSGIAFRRRVILQPGAGEGTNVFPPTYAGSIYATEKRRLPDRAEPVECVLLDSVQSQANRMEEALQQAVDEERFKLPLRAPKTTQGMAYRLHNLKRIL